MRIRRNLTLTTLLSPTTTSPNDAAFTSSDPADEATVLSPRRCSTTTPASSGSSCLVCVLNQSPWDVTDPSSQLEGGLFSLTGTSSVPELSKNSQSLASSVKLSDHNQIEQLDEADALDKHSDRSARLYSDGKVRAEKGHSGAATLSSLSKAQIRASSVKKEKKQPAEAETTPQVGMKRRGRPVKKPATDPNEFYYYSGFGPHWGKKRENINPKSRPMPAPKTAVVEKSSSEASSSRSEEAKGRDIEFVDYDDDDEDEYEDGRRPRVRKRVKARSLKSLM